MNKAHIVDPEDPILLTVLSEISHQITQGGDYSLILDYLFRSLEDLIPYDRIGIALVEGQDEKANLSLKWVRSKLPITHLNLSYSAKLQGSSLKGILDSGRPRIINDLVDYFTEHPTSTSTRLILKDGIRSSLTCPLRSRGNNVGVIFFSSSKPYCYQDHHIHTFMQIADGISLAVDYGRLWNNFDSCHGQEQTLRMLLHDLRSPLAIIQGFTEISQRQPWFQNLNPEGQDYFQIVLRKSHEMQDLLDELSEYDLTAHSANSILPEDVSLQEFLAKVTCRGKEAALIKKMSFQLKMTPNVPSSCRFDPHKVMRVLENLISNAVKYSGPGTEITMSVDASPGRLIFSVRDQGQGIPLKEQQKLFKEFGKTSVRPTAGEVSTGLGLAITKKIVDQHGGNVSVISDPGQGSTFSFWIPVGIA